ncbi:MAG: UDP-N-acetylglucosamine 2-epimerase [Oscillospiraceae bacterium]
MDKEKYIVSVVTGTRAEFGLLRPIMDRIADDRSLSLQLVVTGAHLCEALGCTVNEIEQTGLPIAAKIDILKNRPDTETAIAISRAVESFYNFWKSNRPDLVLLLGDRYETFAAATAAATSDIPIAHIGGGDTTEGAKDEFFRHCITKMSALHFAICERSRRRIIQLGEQPSAVFNTGSSGAQNILSISPIDKSELSADIGFDMSEPFLLCTLHPETLGDISPRRCAEILLAATEKCGMPILFTAANADEGGTQINDSIERYCRCHVGARLVQSLGVKRYLSAMRYCAAVVGNSSSAIVETPSLKKPSVNIGDRQKGRETGANNIDVPWNCDKILQALKKAVSPEFAKSLENMKSPYGDGDTAGDIVRIIKERLSEGISLKKAFCDTDITISGGKP